MSNLSIITSLILGVIPFVIAVVAFCVVESKTKSKLKAFIAFAIVVAITAFVRVYVIDNIDSTRTQENNNATTVEEDEDSEPRYFTFNDIKICLDSDYSIFFEVESAEDLSFEYEDDDGETVDFTDEEKQRFWDNVTYDEPYNCAVLQSWITSDVLVLTSLNLSECAYDTIDGYINSLDKSVRQDDFNIDGVHACTVYFSLEDDGNTEDFAKTVFIYNDKFYSIDTYVNYMPLDDIIDDTIKTIELL